MPTLPIVGAHFRPPAKLVLDNLPSGAVLQLQREPENPYDPHAIAVWVSPEAVPQSQHQTLTTMLAGYGTTLEEFLSGGPCHLGYIPRTEAASLEPFWTGSHGDWLQIFGALAFTAGGKPAVQWDWPPEQEPGTGPGNDSCPAP